MDDQVGRSVRLDLLRRLSPIELVVLRERCRGMTSEEIAAALNIPYETAAMHLGNVYDRLDITYRREGTSMGRLMAFCPLLNDTEAPALPHASQINAFAESPQHPSDQALHLVHADDAALLAQRGGGGVLAPENRNWLYGIAAAIAILLVAILAAILIFAGDDDDDDDQAAADATATALAAIQEETPTEQPAEEPTATETPTEPEPTQEPEPTDTPEPSPTPEPTEEPELTPTTEEPTATPEPSPTETPGPTPTEAPTDTPAPEPPIVSVPQPGEEVFEADWSTGAGDWELPPNWTVSNGVLSGEGPDALPVLAPFEPEVADYAVETVMTIETLDNCDDMLIGPFSRVTMVTEETGDYPAGYIGGVCEGEWRIEAIEEDQNQREELVSGDLDADIEIEGEPHAFRLEIAGDTIRLFIDEQFAGEATDDRFDEPGSAGIYFEGDTQLEVEEFRIEEIQPE